uniref:Protein phosphatase 1 regulatory subunit 1B n=1 Tax=Chelydra serpentina TaxID=8475 RepID=A0A8C3XT18_CHESE
MDPKDRKKIQFSVPAPPSQLDPRAVDMIRRRRPTPAMLFQMSEHSSPGESRTLGEAHLLKTKRTNPCVYTPPSLKGTFAFISPLAKRKLGSSSEVHPCAERPCKVYRPTRLSPVVLGSVRTQGKLLFRTDFSGVNGLGSVFLCPYLSCQMFPGGRVQRTNPTPNSNLSFAPFDLNKRQWQHPRAQFSSLSPSPCKSGARCQQRVELHQCQSEMNQAQGVH